MTAWHVTPELLDQFGRAPEEVDDIAASSIELHLLHCETCRVALVAQTDADALERSWDAVAERIDQPRATVVERVLRVLGYSPAWARLVSATPALQLSAWAALVVVVAGAVLVALLVDDPGPFLVIAPVLPVLAVAVAFAPGADPAGEAGAATPLHGFGLVLRRAVVVLGLSIGLLAVGAVALPGLSLADAAWVLPAFALATGALALSVWVRVEVAAVALAAAWFTVLGVFATLQADPVSVPELPPLTGGGQVVWALLLVAATTVFVTQRDTFARLGNP